MNVEHATEVNLEEVSSWLTTAADCQIWAGPSISFPIDKPRLIDEIMFCPDNSYCYISDSRLAGFGQLFQIRDDWYHLARIISNPACRGQGVGRNLCTQLINYAWQRGGSQVSLNVNRNNVRALALYQSLGFYEQAEHSDENLLYMLKHKGA